jgi:PAS domain-containing protein
MDTNPSALAGITKLDAAVQRLVTLRSGHGHAPSHALLRQTLAQIDQAIEELQVMFEELSIGRDEVEQLAGAVERERSRRLELMESLSVACLFTDERGTIQEANTSALLLLGASVAGLGRDSLRAYAADPDECDAMLARLGSADSVAARFHLRARTGPPLALTVSAARVRNVRPPLWRWFLLYCSSLPPSTVGR